MEGVAGEVEGRDPVELAAGDAGPAADGGVCGPFVAQDVARVESDGFLEGEERILVSGGGECREV